MRFAWMLVVTFLYSQYVFAVPVHDIKTHPALKPAMLVSYSPNEMKFAKYLVSAVKQLKKGKLSRVTTRHLKKLIHSSNEFRELKNTINKLEKISKIGISLNKFHRSCSRNEEALASKSNFHLKEYLNKQIHLYCKDIFLKVLMRKDNYHVLKMDNLRYLEKNLGYYLQNRKLDYLIKYLKKTNKSNGVQKILSNIIAKKIIKSNDIPQKKLLKHIRINSKLSEHVKDKGYQDPEANKYFIREFNEMYKRFCVALREDQIQLIKDQIEEVQTFFEENRDYVSDKVAWKMFNKIGKKLLLNNKLAKKAQEMFARSELLGDKNQREESIFLQLWGNILKGDNRANKKIINEKKLIEGYKKQGVKLRFWIAYAIEKSGQKEIAHDIYYEIVNSSPLNYYSIVSSNKIANGLSGFMPKKILGKYRRPSSAITPSLLQYTPKVISSIKRINIWIDLGHQKFLQGEIDYIYSLSMDQSVRDKILLSELNKKEYSRMVIMQLARLLNYKGEYLQTFKILYTSMRQNLFKVNDNILKKLFPVDYLSHIREIEVGIDPLVILALIRQESAFNPEAISVAGARGLMQLMPATAKRFAGRFKRSKLDNPEFNLKVGIKYFKFLLKKNDGNLVYALSAYNAGETALKRWKDQYFHSDNPLITIESIPYKETRNYVKLIYRNIFFYNILTNKNVFDRPLNETFKVSLKF